MKDPLLEGKKEDHHNEISFEVDNLCKSILKGFVYFCLFEHFFDDEISKHFQ